MMYRLYEILLSFLSVFANQRGEINIDSSVGVGGADGDDPTDDDGDTEDDDDDRTGEDSDDDAPGSGEDRDEGDGDDDPAPDPLSQVLDKLNSFEERLNKLGGQEGDRRGGTGTPVAGDDKTTVPDAEKSEYDKVRSLKVEYKDPSHPFHGKTLGEVYDADPREAYAIDPYYAGQIMLGKERERMAQESEQRRYEQQIHHENDEFREEYAREELGADLKNLPAADRDKIDKVLTDTMTWMQSNGKYGITVSEAYYLMHRKGLVSKAASKAAQKVVNDATRGNVRSISTKGEGGGDAAGADMSKWTMDQMMAHLDTLDDSGYDKLLSSAPKAVRKAFPNLPWNNKK